MLTIVMSGSTLFSHYCGGHLKKAALNITVDPCHSQQAETSPSCHAPTPSCHAPAPSAADDCCHDEATWQQTDEYVVQVDGFEFEQHVFVLMWHTLLHKTISYSDNDVLRAYQYGKPPIPPPVNRQVLLQTFLM